MAIGSIALLLDCSNLGGSILNLPSQLVHLLAEYDDAMVYRESLTCISHLADV
jgi:hypothetical protein